MDFCKNTIVGHESGLYKSIHQGLMRLSPESLKDEAMIGPITLLTMNYMNSAYRSLILKNDKYIMTQFEEMQKLHNHSAICLLNIIFFLLINLHSSLARSQFNLSSYDDYMQCVDIGLEKALFKYHKELINKLSHTCTGIDITTCNPNEDLFCAM